jgi:hypothetical protein
MLNYQNMLIVVFLSVFTSGCALPSALGLIVQPISYLVKTQPTGNPSVPRASLSVTEMLETARGDSASVSADYLGNGNDSGACNNKGPVAVSQLLANARAKSPDEKDGNTERTRGFGKDGSENAVISGRGPDSMQIEMVQLNTFDENFDSIRFKLSERFDDKMPIQISFGTKSRDNNHVTDLSHILQVREICLRLGDICRSGDVKAEPTLPYGQIRFSQTQEPSDA